MLIIIYQTMADNLHQYLTQTTSITPLGTLKNYTYTIIKAQLLQWIFYNNIGYYITRKIYTRILQQLSIIQTQLFLYSNHTKDYTLKQIPTIYTQSTTLTFNTLKLNTQHRTSLSTTNIVREGGHTPFPKTTHHSGARLSTDQPL